MLRKYQGKLYCFSPPVMLATFFIEVALAGYAMWRYKLNRTSRLFVAMLGFLAIFQLAEYMVCGGIGVSAMNWARIGYVAITMLPPLGIHLAYSLAGKTNRTVVGLMYLLAASFIGYFLFASEVFTGSQCLGNYVIFQLGSLAAGLYIVYYYGLLLLSIGLSLQFASSVRPKQRRALHAFTAGYVLFMLPTTIVNTIDPATIAGIPSIMCGFAVLLALVASFWVMPLVGERRAGRQNHVDRRGHKA
jgi:N-terminal 7TM region of histidine kinase